MTRRHLLTFSLVAFAILLSVVIAQAAVVPPTLTLPATLDLRQMVGHTGVGAIGVTVKASDPNGGDWILTPVGLTVDPAAGNVAKGYAKPTPFNIGWLDSDLGAHSGTVTLAGGSPNPANVANADMDVTSNVLDNRQLDVGEIGTGTSSSTAFRIMAKTKITTALIPALQITSGSNALVDGDAVATRVNTVAKGKAEDKIVGLKVQYEPVTPTLTQFNDVGQSADLSAIFTKLGHQQGSINLAPVVVDGKVVKNLLANGEAAAVTNVTVQDAMLDYNVDVLEQRKLKLTTKSFAFNVLKGGSVSTNYVVTSTNGKKDAPVIDSDHVTIVDVGDNSKLWFRGKSDVVEHEVGPLTVSTTRVDGSSASVNLLLSGKMTDDLGADLGYTDKKVGVKGMIHVATAEDSYTNDTKAYKSLNASYTYNVGTAVLGKDPLAFYDSVANPKATVLSSYVADGTKMQGLSSRIAPKGTLADPLTFDPANSKYIDPSKLVPNANPKDAGAKYIASKFKMLTGVVGTETTIADSTAVAGDMTVSMTYRKRSPGEANIPPLSDKLPSGHHWLVSDEVKIDGIGSDVIYALDMTFDNRINLAFDGQTNGTIDAERHFLYIAEMNGDGSLWLKATDQVTKTGEIGTHAEEESDKSLSEFLDAAAVAGYSLAEIAGSWGAVGSDGGLGHSWAIVQGGGSGIFVVAPEPSTLAMLISAGIGLMVAGLRRRWR